jgi:hypothetical protein
VKKKTDYNYKLFTSLVVGQVVFIRGGRDLKYYKEIFSGYYMIREINVSSVVEIYFDRYCAQSGNLYNSLWSDLIPANTVVAL